MRRYPQVMENVRVRSLAELDGSEPVWDAVRAAEEDLADHGRVLVRASGTEPLVRVMVEAETEDVARRHAETIVERGAQAARRLRRPDRPGTATLGAPCAASSATWGPTRPSRSSSKDSGGLSTADTTRRASPCSTVSSRS